MPKSRHRFRPAFRREYRSLPASRVPVLVALGLAFMAMTELHAQDSLPPDLPFPEDTLVDERDRSLPALDRPASMRPSSGPPGNRVDLEVTVDIPEWAAAERSHRFIIFNAYCTSVHAATSLFHVTDSEGKIRREGEVTWTGPECATLTTADDETYDLVGGLDGLESGARVVVSDWLLSSDEVVHRVEGICPEEGMAHQVAEVEPRGPDT